MYYLIASLLYAVSHFDNYYTNDDEINPDKEETKDRVANGVREIKRDDVFPVCGKWALNARLALKFKEDKKASDAVKTACAEYNKQRDTDEIYDASSLLGVTALEELEER